MKDLQFRAWDSEDHIMIDEVQNGFKPFPHSQQFSFSDLINDPSHFTIMQSTGFMDSSGVMIFEGDILELSGTEESSAHGLYELGKWDGQMRWILYPISKGLSSEEAETAEVFLGGEENSCWFTIRGNIYDNPELSL